MLIVGRLLLVSMRKSFCKMEKNNSNKIVQELTLSVLRKYISICESNNLRYFFTGGALIGVLRHKGFIPWDDDIDVGMPRKDYDRFLDIVQHNMPQGYGICNRYTDENWHFDMSQFVDLKSEVEISLAKKVRRAHIWIDVFPLDGLPNNSMKRWFHVKHIMIYRYLIQLAHIDTQVDSHRNRPWREQIVFRVSKLLHLDKLLNTNKLLDNLEITLKSIDYDSVKYAGNMLGRYREREVVSKILFGTPRKACFENIFVNIPQYSEELQKALYGDYMKLPPKEAQVAHNVIIIKQRKL